jgi:hypothetical protein
MWLTACPAESEQPETEINNHQKQQSLRKRLIKKEIKPSVYDLISLMLI